MILQIVFSSVGLFLSLSVAVYFLINLKRIVNKVKVEENEILVSPLSQSKTIFYVVYILANLGLIALLVLSILSLFSDLNFFMYFILIGILVFFSSRYLLNSFLSYLIVKEDKIIRNTIFIKNQTVNISDIKNSSLTQQGKLLLLDQNNKCIASCFYNDVGVKDLVECLMQKEITFSRDLVKFLKIEDKTPVTEENSDSENASSESDSSSESEKTPETKSNDKYSESQIQAFELVGKDFRDNVKTNMRNDIIKEVIIQVVVAALIALFVILLNNYLLLILLLVNVYLAYSKYREMKTKYNIANETDFNLGLKYAYLNKNVIGYHENKNRMFKTSAIMISVLLVFFTAFSGYTMTRKNEISYEKMTTVSGTLSKITEDKIITIQVEDNEEKYKEYTFVVANSLNKYIDIDALKNEKLGQNVELKYDPSVTTTKNVTMYYLRIFDGVDDQEYINQDTFTKYFKDYQKRQMVTFYVSLGITLVVIAFSVGYYYYNKTQAKKETIDLSK